MSESVKKPVAKNMIKNAILMTILAIFLYKMAGMSDKGSIINGLQPVFPIVAASGWLMAIWSAIDEFREKKKSKS
jgi:hypothetical protein